MGRFKDDAWEDGLVMISPLRPKPPKLDFLVY